MPNSAKNLNNYQFNTRNQCRWRLIYYLRVFDSNSGNTLGHLSDVTAEGFMLLSENALPVQKKYLLKLEIFDDSDDEKFVEFSARSVWSNQDNSKHFYEIGFKLLKPSLETKTAIHTLITELKSSS
jgi:hypothetical protein